MLRVWRKGEGSVTMERTMTPFLPSEPEGRRLQGQHMETLPEGNAQVTQYLNCSLKPLSTEINSVQGIGMVNRNLDP